MLAFVRGYYRRCQRRGQGGQVRDDRTRQWNVYQQSIDISFFLSRKIVVSHSVIQSFVSLLAGIVVGCGGALGQTRQLTRSSTQALGHDEHVLHGSKPIHSVFVSQFLFWTPRHQPASRVLQRTVFNRVSCLRPLTVASSRSCLPMSVVTLFPTNSSVFCSL